MSDIIRTRKDGCFQVRSNVWGQFLAPCADPEATADLEKGALDRFELHPEAMQNFIPADLWSRWVQLCFHFAHVRQGDLEVSCRLLRKEDDRSQWRILVPRQEVTGASVRIDSFDEAIDIATGELIDQYPPQGWVPAGSSHSHNTMQLDRFSSTDDASELGCPGLHIVISHIDLQRRQYKATASITANHRRFYLDDAAAVIDLTPTADTFHPAVLEVVQPERQRPSLWLNGSLNQQRQERNAMSLAEWNAALCDLQEPLPSQTAFKSPQLSIHDPAVLDFEDCLHGLWEEIAAVFTAAKLCGLDREDALAEVLDAVRTTYDQRLDDDNDESDTPIHWPSDDSPASNICTNRADSSTSRQLSDSDW